MTLALCRKQATQNTFEGQQLVDRLDITCEDVAVQIVFPQGITCGTQRHSVLYKTVGGVVGQEGGMETCAVNVRVHKMHKCTHEWDMVCPWHSASVSDH